MINPSRYGRDVNYRNAFQENPAFRELVLLLASEILAARETPVVQQTPNPDETLMSILRVHGLPPRENPAFADDEGAAE